MSQIDEDSLRTLAEPSSILEIHYQKAQIMWIGTIKFDPCLFVGAKVICVVYINDLLEQKHVGNQ